VLREVVLLCWMGCCTRREWEREMRVSHTGTYLQRVTRKHRERVCVSE